MKNHYQTLELSPTATQKQIKAAFKSLAVRFHPDKHHGDLEMEERFKKINEAYQILSDPYKKTQFDLQFHYQNFSSTRTQTSSYHHPPRRRPYVEFDYKGNIKSTLYAFGITFLIALVAMGVMGVHKLYLRNKYEKILVERRVIFDQVLELYSSDKIKESLVLMADLAPFKTEEQDMRIFRSEKLEELIFKGEAYYVEKDFEQAIRYYELVDQFSPYRPRAMKAHLARSYRFVNKPHESLRLFAELIDDKYQVIPTLIQIAEVYREELDDNSSSKNYLELAREAAVREYRNRFGKAYSVVITSEYIPYDHYYLFEDLANIYNTMDEPENSLGATHWMKRIWPDSANSYFIAGKSHELMGSGPEACGQYQIARFLGHPTPLSSVCN
ncbi:MAG: J domain-containing protein [Cytophagales bacterium]|nr:J domain-containing protein [Cytophagales bacterium]